MVLDNVEGIDTRNRPEPATGDQAFTAFVHEVEPRLRRALVAALGQDRGREATAEALGWAWEHRSRLADLDHPVRFLFRVGQSRTRTRRRRVVYEPPNHHDILVEPALDAAMAKLSERQRVSVVLSAGFGWTQVEIADLLGIRPSTVQNHVERAMAHLRSALRADAQEGSLDH